jgi:tetratricopeptide (TPR) repeat protein
MPTRDGETNPATNPPGTMPAESNPYVGARPFETGQTLYGREREIAALRYMLTSERIVLLYSPSGAGKSSLINAGLLPRLANRFDIWGPARLNLIPPHANWNRYAWSTIAALERSESVPEMTLAEYAAKRKQTLQNKLNPLILFDQFEEVLRLDPVDLPAKRIFFEQLGDMLRDPSIWALFILREDYLAPLDPYRRLLPTQLQNSYRIDRLTREMAMQAIEKPVETTSKKYAPGVVETLTENLAKIKVQQPDGSFREEPGIYVEPLQLQVVCYDLWEKLKPTERTIRLDKLRDIGEALSNYYVRAVEIAADGIENTQRLIREWFQNKLITPDGIRNQVRHEATASGGLDNPLLASLVDSYIVRAEQRGGSLWYELSHDRLVEPISQNNEAWFTAHLSKAQQRALQWEKEGRPQGLLLRRKELAQALKWASAPDTKLTPLEKQFLAACRSLQRKELAAMALVAAIIVTLLFTAVLGVLARTERDRAEKNLRLARQAVDQSLSIAGRQQARESADTPAMEAFRKELLDKAAAFYTSFIQEHSTDPRLRAEEAAGHSRLGDINRLLDRPEDAVREYKQAIVGFESLVNEHPREVEYRRALAYCHNWLGETLRLWEESAVLDPAKWGQAEREYDEAFQLQVVIYEAAQGNPAYAQELARTHYNRGILFRERGDPKIAESDFRAAIQLLEPIPNPDAPAGSSPPPAQELARVYNDLATLIRRENRTEEAYTLYEQAIAIAERLSTHNPDNREYKYELAQYCDNEARLLQALNRLPAAANRSRQALDIIEELASPGPALTLEQLRIMQLQSDILVAQGSPDAQAASDRERELLERQHAIAGAQADPAIHDLYKNLAVNYIELAQKELKDGNRHEAEDSLQSLAHILPQLLPEDRALTERSYEELKSQLQTKRATP